MSANSQSSVYTSILLKPSSSSYDNKCTRISDSSSDENTHSGPNPINLKLQNTIDEQNSIIATQKEQMNIMMTQLQSLAAKLPQ